MPACLGKIMWGGKSAVPPLRQSNGTCNIEVLWWCLRKENRNAKQQFLSAAVYVRPGSNEPLRTNRSVFKGRKKSFGEIQAFCLTGGGRSTFHWGAHLLGSPGSLARVATSKSGVPLSEPALYAKGLQWVSCSRTLAEHFTWKHGRIGRQTRNSQG